MKRPKYAEDPRWSDVEPIPLDDGGPDALATIAYTDEYTEAMSYLRAVMAAEEHSVRVLELTEHIISMNPAHYTIWLYRAKTLEVLGSDLSAEIAWLNRVALKFIKNYQIWHHRQLVITRIGSADGEFDFLAQMFEKDAKNYHVWSYRQWLVEKFELWNSGELEETERHLRRDIRNNSAWNHRWFLVFGRPGATAAISDAVFARELDFATAAIELAPQNESPWNYVRGLLRRCERPASTIEPLALSLAPLDGAAPVRSSHALDVLADVYAEKEETAQRAAQALDLLASRYDPIRANYWNWRKTLLVQPATTT